MTAGGARIASAIGQAKERGRAAIAAYLTAGFPSRAAFASVFADTAGAADLVEVGVPFSDPMADGATIQHASRVAIADGATLAWIVGELARLAPSTSTPLVLMSYVNPLLAYGIPRLARDLAQAGVAGVIVPDLPLEEQGPYRPSLRDAGLAFVQMVTPATPPDRLFRLAAASEGFVYAVTIAGTTGGRLTAESERVRYLTRVRAATPQPILAGFGVATAADVAALVPPADGVVIGSALIAAVARGESAAGFLTGVRS
jgi:tryptophan synthase alpha chain